MAHGAIAVLTRKSARQILEDGGSGSWVLNAPHARKQSYLVCVRNGQNKDPESGEGHGSAFLIGRISGLESLPPRNGQPRWRILLERYVQVAIEDVWKGWRNPVRYTTLEELGIDPEPLSFVEMPARVEGAAAPGQPRSEGRALTIQEAKEGLALKFGVSPEAIEITIRG